MGTSLHLPNRTTLARRSAGHQQHGGTQRPLSCPELDPEAAQILDPASSPRYNLISDSFYCFKLFDTRVIKPVANKHIIARMNTLLDQVKRDHSISISWTPAHTNSDDHLAQGNAVADHLAARGCAAPHLLTHFRLPALAFRSSAPVGRSVGPRSNWRAAARSAPPPLGETHACLRLIPANPTPDVLSFVA